MKKLGDQNTHFWLAQRMAKVTETDLVKAMQRAELSQEDWADMVRQCRGCDWGRSKGCERWLSGQMDAVDEAPDSCDNRDKFVAMKQALEEVDP